MTLILTHSEIEPLIDMAEVIAAVEAGMRDVATGAATQGERHPIRTPGGQALLVPMLAAIDEFAAIKLLADVPGNAGTGRPVQQSTITLLDSVTGSCLALLHGAAITRARTAAASAVATNYLSRSQGGVLGLIGTGALATTHLQALQHVRSVKHVCVWSRTPASAQRFAEMASDQFGVSVEAMPRAEDVVRNADILCTLTPSAEPVVRGAWLTPGMHINAVGTPPRLGFRELDEHAVGASRIVVDDRLVAAAESDELRAAVAAGLLVGDQRLDELGEVVAGTVIGRASDSQITLYKSLGVGIQDVVTAALVYTKALTKGVGTLVELRG
jgi:ornithine cyclodeaminase/alanine dehydrogenase